jgi:hypothetical protein|tara:strand:+ start:1269 stop:1526 length:258 start_codon:yes stop_codon:yes gene_type:complete
MSLSPIFRIAGVLTAMATFALWAAGDFNMGWTKDRIEVRTVDPILGIEGISYEETYIAGLEVLAAGCLLGVVLFTLGIFFRRKGS